MAQILSQDEVDALLKGIDDGDVAAPPKSDTAGGSVNAFDFSNQDRVVRGNLPTLEMVHDRFSRSFRSTISAATRRSVDVNTISHETIKFGEFMRTVPLPSSLHIFKIEPLKGLGVCIMEGRLVFAFIDHFFGGRGRGHVKMEGRDFTPIEQRIIRMVVEMIFEDYRQAWEPVIPAQIEHVGSEINPQFVNVVPFSEVVFGVNLEVELEESIGKLKFCLPYSMLEPIKDKLKSGFQGKDDEVDNDWQTRLHLGMSEVGLGMRVELGSTQITGRELMQLKKGDIISLSQDQYSPITAYIEDVPKFRGHMGVFRGSHALKVEKIIPRNGDFD